MGNVKKGTVVTWNGKENPDARKKIGAGPFVVKSTSNPSGNSFFLEVIPYGHPEKSEVTIPANVVMELKFERVILDYTDFSDDAEATFKRAIKPFGLKMVPMISTEGSDTYGYFVISADVKLTRTQLRNLEAHTLGCSPSEVE